VPHVSFGALRDHAFVDANFAPSLMYAAVWKPRMQTVNVGVPAPAAGPARASSSAVAAAHASASASAASPQPPQPSEHGAPSTALMDATMALLKQKDGANREVFTDWLPRGGDEGDALVSSDLDTGIRVSHTRQCSLVAKAL
jgi:hypothetical protein